MTSVEIWKNAKQIWNFVEHLWKIIENIWKLFGKLKFIEICGQKGVTNYENCRTNVEICEQM